MNEMNFRTKLLTHPQMLDDEMLAYLEENPDKKQALQTARDFDQQVSEALDVDIPEGLHARILLNQSYQQNLDSNHENPNDETLSVERENVTELKPKMTEKPIKGGTNSWFNPMFDSWKTSIAASVIAFTVVFGGWQYNQLSPELSPEATVEHIIAHIEEDPSLMTAVKLPTSEQELQQLFANVGAQLSKPVEGMSYAGMCDVEGQQGLHIVMQDKGEPITIIVMPGHKIAAIEAFQQSGYQGELVPVQGGVVAIVANTMEQVAMAQLRFFNAVKFA